MYAIAFLAAIAAVKTGLEMQQRGPNHYVTLGVTRASNPLEIKRAYKRLSLQLHPDKNPSPDASDQFDAVKKAYDVLLDMEMREVYNKYGIEGVNNNKRYDETQFLIEVAIYYVTWGMMAFMLTMGKKSGDARNWTFTGLVVMLVAEVVLMSSTPSPIPTWIFPQMTEYDLIFLIHALFPAFMNGCRSLGAYLFIDLDAQTRQLLLALQGQNKDILLVLREVQIGVQTIHSSGGSVISGGNNAVNSTSGLGVTTDGGGGASFARATPTGKLKELQTRLQASNTNVAQAVQQLKTDGNAGKSNMGFYMMILGYIVVSYLFS